ncbi:MAG TPA: hypothetical protein VIV57_26120 [Anaeromyxobacter sp.]
MRTKIAAVAVALAASACSGARPVPPAAVAAKPECSTGPEWTCVRSGPCFGAELKGMLCAVGSAESISSYTLGRETAATRARVEMGAVVKTKVDGFTRAVQDSVSKSGAGEESVQKIGNLSQAVVDETLHAVSVPKTYYNEQMKAHFAMATLDSKAFIEALKGLKQAAALSEQVKAEIDARAENVVSEWKEERR